MSKTHLSLLFLSAGTVIRRSMVGCLLMAIIAVGTVRADIVADSLITISAIVLDETGEPVIGANILQDGTSNGTVTDLDGHFVLEVPAGAAITVSYLGHKTRHFELSKLRKPLRRIMMEEDTQRIGEVVVTAMGIQKDPKRLGYAMSSINADDLVKSGASNIGSAIYGKASGVRINQTQGGSAGAVSINVRGLSSITGNNQPLVILDGVPIRNGGTGSGAGTGFSEFGNDGRIRSNGLVDINPEDIENINILKGASATALYGSEAANGAVVITSKRAKERGLRVEFTAQAMANTLAYLPQVQTKYGPGTYSNDYGEYEIETGGFYQRTYNNKSYKSLRTTNQAFGPEYDGSDVLYWDGSVRPYLPVTSDPWRELFRTGLTQTYTLAITQGASRASTRFAYTFTNEIPNALTGNFNKHNFKLTGSYRIAPPLTLEYSVNYLIQDVKNRPQASLNMYGSFSNAFSSFTDIGLLKSTYVTSLGYRNTFVGGDATLTPEESWAYDPGTLSGISNMLWGLYHKNSREMENRLIGMVRPTWNITSWLNLRAQVSTDITSAKQTIESETERPNALYDPSGEFQMINRRYDIVYGDVMLNFNYNVKRFSIAASAGWTGRYENMNNMRVATNGGLATENWFDIAASRYTPTPVTARMELLKTGYMGTLSLGWDDYLFVEVTGRQERSSTLKDQSFFYPSVNASFVFTDALGTLRPVWWNIGKLRFSYGVVGNAPDAYAANIVYEQGSDNGFTWNYVPAALGNANIRPEQKYEYEAGFESAFLKDRLSVDVSYFNNVVKDQILATPQPWSSGVSTMLMNVGEVANYGWDFAVRATPVMTRNFRWDISATYGLYRNKVLKLADGVPYLEIANIGGSGAKILAVEGQPMGDIYTAVPQTDDAGNYLVSDNGLYLNKTEHEKVGNINPDGVGGMYNSFSFYGFSIDFGIDFRIGGDVINEMNQYATALGITTESLAYRDTESGGLSYYYPGNDHAAGIPVQVNPGTPAGPAGERVYNDGVINEGIVASTGQPNTRIIPAGYYYNTTYSWGTSPEQLTYRHSVYDNTYVKLRDLTVSYRFPKKWIERAKMSELTLSLFGRNLFYFYKSLKGYDPESSVGTSWSSQAIVGVSTASTRSFGITLKAAF